MTTLKDLARDHVISYFERWDQNIQFLIDKAQDANVAVEEIIDIKDEPSFAQLVVSNLIDMALSMVIPGAFQLSQRWRDFAVKDAITASNIQFLVGLAEPAREARTKANELYLKKMGEAESVNDSKRGLRADNLSRLTNRLGKVKSAKQTDKDEARKGFNSIPDYKVNLPQVYLDFPWPGLLSNSGEDVQYALEWVLLRVFCSEKVRFEHVRMHRGHVPLTSAPIAGEPTKVEGLSKAACEKIFARYSRTDVKFYKDTPLLGSMRALPAISGWDDMVRYFGVQVKTQVTPAPGSSQGRNY